MTLPAPRKRQRLEERVGVQVEDRDSIGTDARRQEHEAELRDRRVREHLLDVGLHDGDRRGEERGGHADRRHQRGGLRRMQEDAVQPRDQVDARRHHRRRVDQGGHRRRTGHRVRQPDMQRDLRRLAGRADEQEHAHQARRHRHRSGQERRIDLVHLQRAERAVQQEHAEQEAGIADAIGDEGLLARGGLGRILEPEADQQVGRQPDAFPAHEQHQQRTAQHQHQHEEQEQVEVREVARVALVLVHVADRVDVNQRADAGDDQCHHRRQTVEIEGDFERAVGKLRPGEHGLHQRRAARHHLHRGADRDDERSDRQPASHHADEALAEPVAQQAVDQETDQRQDDDG